MQIVIAHDSEAFQTIKRAVDAFDTDKISIEIRIDGLAMKVNEATWTHTMSIEPCAHTSTSWGPGFSLKCRACGRIFP